MQADAEHQQHHADLGQLGGKRDVGHEAGRGRADGDAGGEIADQGRQAHAHGEHAEQQAEAEGGSDGGDQADVVVHADAASLVAWARGAHPT
jgi:hypothetical protein